MTSEHAPSGYQAAAFKEFVLDPILSEDWSEVRKASVSDIAELLGCYFPSFGDAFAAWTHEKTPLTESALKEQAEKVMRLLPSPPVKTAEEDVPRATGSGDVEKQDRKGPTRYQAKVWTDTVLGPILSGEMAGWTNPLGAHNGSVVNGRQIGRYFPGFGRAFELWLAHQDGSHFELLKDVAERVFLSLPVPFEHPDVCHELDAAEETIAQQLKYMKLLEDLIEDYDSIGFWNVCKCGPSYMTSDSRCCWVRRSWERLIAYREAHLGGSYGRMTKRPSEEHEEFMRAIMADMDNEEKATFLVTAAWPDGVKALVKRLLDEKDALEEDGSDE